MTTHDGDEAAECCRLLSFIVVSLINYEGTDPKKDILDTLGQNFKSDNLAVMCLARSEQEPAENMKTYNAKFNKSVKDRNWNWKQKDI